MSFAPGLGRPLLGKVHPLRQRRVMRRLLCQVCGGPADVTEDGELWLFPNGAENLPGWPELVINHHPPVCAPCAVLSVRLCPSLRRTYVAIRAHSAVSAVGGILPTPDYPVPTPGEDVVAPFGDPRLRWTLATELVRNLHNCIAVDLDRLAETTRV